MALVMGATVLTACSDSDDYYANKTPLLTDGSVVTGSSDVTATTATIYGTVAGLEEMSTASYTTGFYYGTAENALTETLTAQSAGEFSGSLTGLMNNQVIYYQAYVTLQGRLTYKGEVKSLITTNATVTTGAATNIDFADATMAGSVSKYPADAKAGIVVAAVNDQEQVRAGLRIDAAELTDNFSVTKQGLAPNTAYYYAAFLDLGAGIIYGDVKAFQTAEGGFDVENDFVDLGLSVKWAKRNVGAKKATDFGGYFGFGDLAGVNPSILADDYAAADTYKTANDIAYLATGGKGTLPTADLFEELFRLCTVEWAEQDGVNGYLVTAKNGNSIFLPAAGKRVESTVSETGLHGYYLTGSSNKSNTGFAVDYEFTASTGVRATRAVYEALSVRPVTVARNVTFDKEKLFTTWYLDNGAPNKTQHVFDGPFTQWGAHDNWGTITNNEPNPYETIHWEMGTDNGWIGYTYNEDYGSMTFVHGDDGKDYVIVKRIASDGTVTEDKGEITVDEENKTVDMGNVKILCANTWLANTSGVRNILTLTDDGLQIGVVADGTYQYSLNYYSQAKADKDATVKVNLICVGNDWNGTWGTEVDAIAPEALDGQHSFKYDGACNGLKVNTIDFVGLKERFPNAFVRIDAIKLDGQEIKFNANNFCYGDIEDNGNFRVEMANVWGKTAKNEKIVASPFSSLTDTDNDPAFTFSSSMEVVYTIAINGPEGTYLPTLLNVNAGWGTASWDGLNQGETFDVVLNKETAKYEVTKKQFDIVYQDADNDYSGGTIMTFIQIADIYRFFPGMHCTLDALKLDGSAVTYDKSKVLDSNESPKYRLELWNTYGATANAGCAFGTPVDGCVAGLGFSSKMELSFTIQSLFAVPEF